MDSCGTGFSLGFVFFYLLGVLALADELRTELNVDIATNLLHVKDDTLLPSCI